MSATYLPALAAFGGSAFGGLTSFAATWFTQRRTRRFSQEKSRGQKLYRQFIEKASKLYADALVHDNSEVSTLVYSLVNVYALIGRMRVLSSDAVIEGAEAVARKIIDTYFSPNRTFPELRELMNSRVMDPLREFSEACRNELRALNRARRYTRGSCRPVSAPMRSPALRHTMYSASMKIGRRRGG
jgi:hypothetical protein